MQPVVFRTTPSQNVQLVELYGDMRHWRTSTKMSHAEGNTFEATLHIPPGTYEYKYRLRDGSWFCDPHNPRTRSLGGNRNSLLVIGGCDEPVLHAPVPPYVHIEEDGRICVRAGLRKGTGDQLQLRWDEGHGFRRSAMRLLGEEDEHLLFESHVAGSGPSVELLFQLGNGQLVGRPGGAGLPIVLDLVGLRRTTPSWWKNAVLYTIFVDRFRPTVPLSSWPRPEDGLHNRELGLGGDLGGILDALPYLQDLGVSVLHLTPIVLAGSCHRYDAVDPRAIDPALGGQAAFDKLLDACHRRGIRVLFDITLTHVHRDFFAFEDVRRRGEASPYWDWFHIRSYPFREGPGIDTGYEHYHKGRWQEPLLRLEHEDVARYIETTVVGWAQAGVDGFRIDAAADAPLPLIGRLAQSVRRVREDVVLFGEVTVDNTYAWTRAGLDAVTDFTSQELLYDLLWRRTKGASQFAREQEALAFRRSGPCWRNITFTATHDQPRLLSLVADPAIARLGHLLVLMRASVPALYYGDEVGLWSEDCRDFEGVWPDRAPMVWEPVGCEADTHKLIRAAIHLRKKYPALHLGTESFGVPESPNQAPSPQDVLWIRRTWKDDVFDVILHAGEETCSVRLPSCEHEDADLVFQIGEAEVGAENVRLGPWSAVVVHRIPSSDDLTTLRATIDFGRELVCLSFREGLTEALCLPTKLYLTVTERCNLTCLHCINHSPSRTRDRIARDMPPWVLDRLREVLVGAEYVAFSHGGESLVSPRLFDALSLIQRIRPPGSKRCEIHLLTNGMLLTPERLDQLLALGVTSLAVSIDGPTADINDAIRQGSRLSTVQSHIREAVRRREDGADLRIGVSTVLGESSLPHADALARMVLDLGVDWLKVEEMVPVNGFAREQVAGDNDRVTDALQQLRILLDPAGVVLVDHMHDHEMCDCRISTHRPARSFRKADDFANRARFQPCRMAWDTACIDPDGTVHPVSYEHPAIGNLLWAELFAIWDGEGARQVRQEALRRYPAELRERCPDDP